MNPLFFTLFLIFVVVMLALDLFVFHKRDAVVSAKEGALWTAVWVALAMGFAVLVYLFGDWMVPPGEGVANVADYRREMTEEFLAGYFLEESLSIDNIFVMIMIFVSFGIKREYYHRVLFWGIFGAIVLRFVFIFAIGALVEQFAWILTIFGAILVYSGVKMFFEKTDGQIDTASHPVVKFASKHFPVTNQSYGHDFFHREEVTKETNHGTVVKQVAKMTPLFLVLLVIEFSDISFAVDSIPAVFTVTQKPVIVYTSNIFAIMGLRSLFFLLSDISDRFWLLRYGLGVLLCFIGVKMLGHEFFGWEISALASLAVILGILTVSVVLSMLIKKKEEPRKQ